MKDNKRCPDILRSVKAEIDNFEQPSILTLRKLKDIPKESRKDIIGVYMFHKEKVKADGSFYKDKIKLVLLSNKKDPNNIFE